MMSVDPVDDSFWYTTEYYAATGSFDFNTRIANFELGGVVNQAPVVTITAPADGSNFFAGDPVTFVGTASDTEDGDLTASIGWMSDLDGNLGTGGTVTCPGPGCAALSVGTHTVTASATDSGSKSGSDQITVVVNPVPGSTMHVHNAIVQGTQGGGKRQRGTATVTIFDNFEAPVASANVSVTFSGDFNETVSGTTDLSGVVTVVTSGTTRNPVFSTCVSGVTHASLTYDKDANEDGFAACGGTPTSVHIANVQTGTSGKGKNRSGTATVSIVFDSGAPAANYLVTGTFSGTINEVQSGTTGSNGQVTLTTSGTARNPSVSFCVDTVSGTLPYEPLDNPDPAFDCSPSVKSGIAVASLNSVVEPYALEQNYPNPFRGATLIDYVLGEGGPVSIRVYNLLGQEVSVLVDGFQEAGRHTVAFQGTGLGVGMYMYVMQAGEYTDVRRMTLLK
jgi:hypothetical protein